MSRLTVYTATPDFDIPASVLASADCPEEVTDARNALEAANAATAEAVDKLHELRDSFESEDAALRAAARAAKKLPVVTADTVREALLADADRLVRSSSSAALKAAQSYEEALTEHRPALRELIVAGAPEAREAALSAIAKAQEAVASFAGLVASARELDFHAADYRTRGLVTSHYRAIDSANGARFRVGNTFSVGTAFGSLSDVIGSTPVDELLVDPLSGEHLRELQAIAAAAERKRQGPDYLAEAALKQIRKAASA